MKKIIALTIISVLASISLNLCSSHKRQQPEPETALAASAPTTHSLQPATTASSSSSSSCSQSSHVQAKKSPLKTSPLLDVVTGTVKPLQDIILGYLEDEWKEDKTFSDQKRTVASVAWSKNGKYLASASSDNNMFKGEIIIWDVNSGEIYKKLVAPEWGFDSISWSPDGNYIVSVGANGSVIIWDVNTGKIHKKLEGFKYHVNSVSWSSNGQYIAAGGVTSIIIWDAATGQIYKKLKGHTNLVNSVAWSPDDKYIASGSFDHSIRIWDVETGQEVKKIIDGDMVFSIAWSPGGKYIASGGHNGLIIWNAQTGKKCKTFSDNGSYSLSWTPNDNYIAEAKGDLINIWDIKSGQKVKTITTYIPIGLGAVSWSPDGTAIAFRQHNTLVKIVKIWSNPFGMTQSTEDKFEQSTDKKQAADLQK